VLGEADDLYTNELVKKLSEERERVAELDSLLKKRNIEVEDLKKKVAQLEAEKGAAQERAWGRGYLSALKDRATAEDETIRSEGAWPTDRRVLHRLAALVPPALLSIARQHLQARALEHPQQAPPIHLGTLVPLPAPGNPLFPPVPPPTAPVLSPTLSVSSAAYPGGFHYPYFPTVPATPASVPTTPVRQFEPPFRAPECVPPHSRPPVFWVNQRAERRAAKKLRRL
jgi:hypothetical protein